MNKNEKETIFLMLLLFIVLSFFMSAIFYFFYKKKDKNCSFEPYDFSKFMITNINTDISSFDSTNSQLNSDWKINGKLCIENNGVNVCANKNDIKYSPGTIFQYAGETPPPFYLICDGRSLPISKYTELYNILGDKYGGDNLNYFNIPDLRGRIIIGSGHGYYLTNRILGSKGGAENETLMLAFSEQYPCGVNLAKMNKKIREIINKINYNLFTLF